MSTGISSNALYLRQKWIQQLGGLPTPTVKNAEWLYMLEEDTRNSLMIEGVFVSKQQLRAVLSENPDRSKRVPEIVGAFEASSFAYEYAYQQFLSQEFYIQKASVRALHALLFKSVEDFPYIKGDFRRGNIIITGSGFESPDYTRITELFDKILSVVHSKKIWTPWRKAAFLHAFFENLHPFPDGNGRIGRILSNWVLIAHGFPNISIKHEEKEAYFAALESSDKGVGPIFTGKTPWTKFSLQTLKPLEDLLRLRLAVISDFLIMSRWEHQGKDLMTLKQMAQVTGKNQNTLKVAASKKQIISIQKKDIWYSHPDLLS